MHVAHAKEYSVHHMSDQTCTIVIRATPYKPDLDLRGRLRESKLKNSFRKCKQSD